MLAALDSPGEYFIDRNTGTIYVWMPDSTEPAGVRVKVRDYCLQGRLNLTNLTFWGCTFYLRGNALHVKNVSLMYPSFHKTIDPRCAHCITNTQIDRVIFHRCQIICTDALVVSAMLILGQSRRRLFCKAMAALSSTCGCAMRKMEA
eukprot:SAG31_NODE_527_length_14452_cov_4.274925_7_plen_147_part_00